MPIRDFMDADGVSWRVWSTVPAPARQGSSRLESWLTFESESSRRRLTPIPDGWEYAPAATLATLCARAIIVPMGHFGIPPLWNG